jgi:hypothetical protein
MLRGSPQVSMGLVSPIPQIVACGVWGVGPLSLFLWGSSLSAAGGLCSFLFCLNGLTPWGCTIPLWGCGFDGETTLPVWAAGWRQDSGVGVTLGVVWGGLHRGRRALSLLSPTVSKCSSHWTCVLTLCLCTGWMPLLVMMVMPPSFPSPPPEGVPQLDCGGPLGVPLSLWCAVLALLHPPLDVVGDSAWTRARVSPGLGLAPALLLGLGLPFHTKSFGFYHCHLALAHAPQAQA